jgi:hypothetical protein
MIERTGFSVPFRAHSETRDRHPRAIKPSPDFNSFDPGYDTDLLAKVN